MNNSNTDLPSAFEETILDIRNAETASQIIDRTEKAFDQILLHFTNGTESTIRASISKAIYYSQARN